MHIVLQVSFPRRPVVFSFGSKTVILFFAVVLVVGHTKSYLFFKMTSMLLPTTDSFTSWRCQ